VTTAVRVDRDDVRRLVGREAERLDAASGRSAALFRRASLALAGGVASDHQRRDPWPLYLVGGAGPLVTDADGVRRIDFHNGFGAMVQGHAHSTIARAIAERAASGTHLGMPTEDTIAVAEELARRWRLPLWRFASSGTEATMAAVRIARAATGRDVVVTATGAYHGHADLSPTATVEFNDAGALDERLEALAGEGRPAACVLLEPAFLLGVVLPRPGYLEAARETARRHGALLVFDEAKTGLSVGPAGASGRWDVVPDLVTLAKTLGGGIPAAAIGGSTEAMAGVASGAVAQVGTYNGNALSMAAARATLDAVLTGDAFTRLDALGARMADGCRRVLAEHSLPGHALSAGARGCVTLTPGPVVDHAAFAATADPDLERLIWLHAANRGIYLTPARPEQWTLSVAHGDRDVDAYLEAFDAFAGAVSRSTRGAP